MLFTGLLYKIRHPYFWILLLAGLYFTWRIFPLRIGGSQSDEVSAALAPIIPDTCAGVFFLSRDTSSIVIPLKRAGRLFMIEAVIDGEAGNLIFDTGASGLVLNKTYFRDYVVNGHQSSRGITGTVNNVDLVTINSLRIQDLTYNHVRAALANLGHIENKRKIKVLGLFGFALLRDYEVILDFVRNEMRLLPVDKKGNRLNMNFPSFRADGIHKIRFLNNVAFLQAAVGGKMLTFCFDTGAETNAISTFVSKPVMNTITITRSLNLNGAGSMSTEVLVGVMNDFTLDNRKFGPMETVITYLDHLNDVYGCHIDGVLGYNFISKCAFCINFEKKQLEISILKP